MTTKFKIAIFIFTIGWLASFHPMYFIFYGVFPIVVGGIALIVLKARLKNKIIALTVPLTICLVVNLVLYGEYYFK